MVSRYRESDCRGERTWMVCGPLPMLKLIVVVSVASWIACRNEPGPLSLVLVTVRLGTIMLGRRRSSSGSRHGRQDRRRGSFWRFSKEGSDAHFRSHRCQVVNMIGLLERKPD